MFFDNPAGLLRVAVVGTLAYVAIVLILRVSGKRTLSKWNAFDFVVTIALGSTLATVLLSKQVAAAEGVLALALLVWLQFVMSWVAVRSTFVRRLIKSRPTYLYSDGAYVEHRLLSERVTQAEVRAAVRQQGIGSMREVEAVVLETDGSVSIVRRSAVEDRSALQDVE
jgi:uncharacterized membrane protein YcaP (DUF421 family)